MPGLAVGKEKVPQLLGPEEAIKRGITPKQTGVPGHRKEGQSPACCSADQSPPGSSLMMKILALHLCCSLLSTHRLWFAKYSKIFCPDPSISLNLLDCRDLPTCKYLSLRFTFSMPMTWQNSRQASAIWPRAPCCSRLSSTEYRRHNGVSGVL